MALKWREKLRYSRRAYAFLAVVFLLVALFTLDRVSASVREARPPKSVIHPPVKAVGKDETVRAEPPKEVDPWTFFRPSWGTVRPRGGYFYGPVDMPAAVDSVLGDPDARLEPDFRVPPYLRDRVRFWMQVHAQYGNHLRLVHDREDLSVVYGYLDFRSIYRDAKTTAEAESVAYRAESKILRELRTRLFEAADLAPYGVSKQTAEERASLRAFLSLGGALGEREARERIMNVRTQTGQRDEFIAALRRSKELLPYIESVFRREGLPVALGRIPFVESSFNVKAKSRVGAVGAWQFMPATARQMISRSHPELWADPARQTLAATKVLKILRSILPDWSTSVTAYNSGVGRLNRLVRAHRAKNLAPLLGDDDVSDGLGFAGENFYAQFLSANLVEAYREELLLRWITTTPDLFFLVFRDGVRTSY